MSCFLFMALGFFEFLIMKSFSLMQRSQYFWPGLYTLHSFITDHFTSGSFRLLLSLLKFNFLSQTNADKAVLFLLYSARNVCRCPLTRSKNLCVVIPIYSPLPTSALYIMSFFLHSPGAGHLRRQAHCSEAFMFGLLLSSFKLWKKPLHSEK